VVLVRLSQTVANGRGPGTPAAPGPSEVLVGPVYDARFSGGLFGLRMSITVECFQVFGKKDNLSIAL
jgi:hypothetical protein